MKVPVDKAKYFEGQYRAVVHDVALWRHAFTQLATWILEDHPESWESFREAQILKPGLSNALEGAPLPESSRALEHAMDLLVEIKHLVGNHGHTITSEESRKRILREIKLLLKPWWESYGELYSKRRKWGGDKKSGSPVLTKV